MSLQSPGAAVLPAQVLLADPHTGDIALVALEMCCSCSVRSVTNCAEVIEQTRQQHWDLLVMDVTLPDCDGFELIRTLKGSPTTAGIPILVVTAFAAPDAIEEGRRSGCDSYITKPFSLPYFIAEAERLIRGGAAG